MTLGEAAGLFLSLGGDRESHIVFTVKEKVHSLCTDKLVCLSDCHLGGRL